MPNPFIEQLVGLCRKWPTRSKWVIVPSHSIGHNLAERLVLGGTDWTNLRFVTPLDLALRMAGPFLVERNIEPSEDTLGPALMVRLLLELRDHKGYFRALADQPSIGEALWKTVRELRMAGITSKHLASALFGSADKKRELTNLLSSYEEYLAAAKVADMPAVFEEAARHRAYCPIQAGHCWTELPDTTWPVLQQQLIDSLSGEHIEPARVMVSGLRLPRRLRPSPHALANPPSVTVSSNVDRLAFLLNSENAPGPISDNSLEVFHAGGRDAEIEEVLRRALKSGLGLDQIEIACATSDLAALAWEKAKLHGWPATSEYGHAATLTRPGRALLAWCDWVDSDFDAAALRRLLQSGDLNPVAFSANTLSEPFSPGQAARLLLRAEAAWGADTYTRALGGLIAHLKSRMEDPDSTEERQKADQQSIARAESLLAWVEGLIKAVPAESEDGTMLVRGLAEAAVAFLEQNSARASALDALAIVRVKDSLAQLNQFGDYRASLTASLRFVRDALAGLSVGADRMRPGHLLLSRLSQAGMSGRPLLFVAGLEEGRLFSRTLEDPVLLDRERSQISPWLRTSRDHLEENVYAVISRLSSLDAKQVCFSFSCRDTRQFRETFPSWIVLEAWRIKTGKPGATFDELNTALREPVSRVPASADEALSDAGWWLNRVKRGGDSITPALLDCFSHMARGVEAERRRNSSEFTEFDGYVPAAGPELDPSATGRSISATTLEGASSCPFRYFLQRGLGVQPLDEAERQADIWLDPMKRGSELHAIFASIMREVRSEGQWPPSETFISRTLAMGEDRLNQLKEELPPPSEEVFSSEREEFLDDLELFMKRECGETDVEGVGFEVGFGSSRHFSAEDKLEPLSDVEPVAIELGKDRVIRLRGRIDRINRLSDGSYEIVDYKTGKFWQNAWTGIFVQGTRLQHALYSIAARWLIGARQKAKPRIIQAAYIFPTIRGWDKRVDIPQDDEEAVRNVLNDLCDTLASGAFIHTSEEQNCKWCDYAAACGKESFECSGSKLEVSNATVLESFRRLRKHE